MNRRLAHVLFALAVACVCAGCGLFSSQDATRLRIENASDLDFTSVRVSFPEADASYGAIAAGRKSEYRRVDDAYRYGFIEVETQGETYTIQPFDYVGEEPLDPGRYTYQLDIVDGELVLDLK